MERLLKLFFNPPPIPPIELPFPARMIPHIKLTIAKAFELAYHRGVLDGVIAGVLITMLFVPSIRNRATKGADNASDSTR
jgi:hypothetical protein